MQTEAYEAHFAAEVERSFRDDAIRTAVLIDDQFPDYSRMRDASDDEFGEIKRATNLYAYMHGRGLICDILNWRKPADADATLLDKVRKSDLIVLDYQLGSGGSATALKILRHLATSSHFNLVVLYTAEASTSVALAAAAAMRGVAPPAPSLMAGEDVLGLAEELLATERFREISSTELCDYLTDGRTPWSSDLREAMKDASIPFTHLKQLADHVARDWIRRLLGEYLPPAQDVLELPLRCEIENPRTMWIHCGSCFVAVVGKLPPSSQDNEGEHVWGRLGAALQAWRPNLYRLILSEIQNALELEAVADHERWLSDNLSLGLGLYLLESDDAALGRSPDIDIEGNAQSLIDRFVDIIRRRLASHQRVSSTAVDLLSARLKTPIGVAGSGETARHVRARELANIAADRLPEWQREVLPAVNAFMVSDEFRGSHVTTGTVLRDPSNGYWLCASPACDLVPRRVGPAMVQLLKLEPHGSSQSKFSQGEFVVIGGDEKVIILRALGANARQPKLAMIVLPNGTRVSRKDDGFAVVFGWIASEEGLRLASIAHGFPVGKDQGAKAGADHHDARAEPAVGDGSAEADVSGTSTSAATTSAPDESPIDGLQAVNAMSEMPVAAAEFVVVCQLRSSFATRFLMAAGQHQSRVGVDFVDL